MSAPAIRGCFSDFRLVRGRKVCQLVIELPIEEADAALATLGGLPQPAAERWIALAPLNITSLKPQKEKRPFQDLKAVMQAGIRCNEPAFWRFLNEQFPSLQPGIETEDDAAAMVRAVCGVTSRKSFNLDPKAAAKWRDLESQFQAWKMAPEYA